MQKAKLDLSEMEKCVADLNIKNLELNENLNDKQSTIERIVR